MLDALKNGLDELQDDLEDFQSDIGRALRKPAKKAKRALKKQGVDIDQGLREVTNLANGVRRDLEELVDEVTGDNKRPFEEKAYRELNKQAEVLQGEIRQVQKDINKAFKNPSRAISEAIKEAKNALEELGQAITSAFKELGKMFKSAFSIGHKGPTYTPSKTFGEQQRKREQSNRDHNHSSHHTYGNSRNNKAGMKGKGKGSR